MTSMSKPTQRTSEFVTGPTAAPQESEPFYVKLLRRNAPGHKRVFQPLPETSQQRLDASAHDVPIDTEKLVAATTPIASEKKKTVLYLAYGSNLCDETFRGVRGVQPLSQVNVLVPSLRLTFDLPGIPYTEPCFANSARRSPDTVDDHKPSSRNTDYHKDRWHKGLVGVVYEVTLNDYAHIIATEGGGSSYQDILVDCYVLPKSDTVPTSPTSKPFQAHTLFAPVLEEDEQSRSTERNSRPDPSYAQPSARYLKLITDGATERELPAEYQKYLHDIRPYTTTTRRQAVGKVIFLSTWMPFILMIFSLSRKFQDKKGRSPKWVAVLSSMLFKGMWISYDGAFKRLFGDGERTIGDSAIQNRSTYSLESGDAETEGLLEAAAKTLDLEVRRNETPMKGDVTLV